MNTHGKEAQAEGRASRGFSLHELLIVIIISGILAGIVAPAVGRIEARMDTDSARDSFILYAARARSLAIDRGTLTKLVVDPATDRAVIRVGDTPLDSMDFAVQNGVDLRTGTDAAFTVCYSSRGVAMLSCNSGLGSDTAVTFSRGGSTATATMRPLGQVQRAG